MHESSVSGPKIVATEREEWQKLAAKGDQTAIRAIEEKDPEAIAALRSAFVANPRARS